MDTTLESEQTLKQLIDIAPNAIIVLDDEQRIILFNAAAERMFGYTTGEALGKPHDILIPDRFISPHRKYVIDFGNSEISHRFMSERKELLGRRKNGEEFPAEGSIAHMEINGKKIYMTIFKDIAQEKEAQNELKRLVATVEHSINIIFITDITGKIVYVNPMFEKVTGWQKQDAIGKNPRILASGETPKEQYDELWNTILSGKTYRYIIKNKRRDGWFYWANTVITPIKDDKGEITNFLAVQEDITEKKIIEDNLMYLRDYDELTGLFNRTRFMDMVSEWITINQGQNKKASLFIIDIDDFKSINDGYGHIVGDEFIHRTAAFLKELKEESRDKEYIIGRMGGDEFVIFMPYDTENIMSLAEKIKKGIEGILFVPLTAPLTVSIGIAIYPEQGIFTRGLFTRADAAMQHAKQSGKNQYRVYTNEDSYFENLHLRLKEKAGIQKAISEDRFLPWFQPILSLKENTITHYEALARLKDEDGTILPPAKFIDTAERFGIIGEIDRIIIEKTMRVQTSEAQKGRYISFGINLSAKDLAKEDTIFFIHSKLLETGAHSDYLVFEITETSAVYDIRMAVRFINALKSIGCRFSLDDFGVGFTSFVYLREMSVDYIKIDGAFIKNLHENPNDRLFVKSIVDVAKGMGIKTIAEFVEREETIKLLKEIGVDYAQGYAVGKPAPTLLDA